MLYIGFSCYSTLKDPRHDIGKGLKNMTTDKLVSGFQVSDDNPMLGIDSRAALLRSLGESLLGQSDVFGDQGRPGNLVGKVASLPPSA